VTRAHALLSASGAERWLACGPSARLEDDLPDQRSEHADNGTFGHAMVEHCLINGLDVAQLCGTSPWEESAYFTKEMQDAAQYCIDYARELQRTVPGALAFYEQRIDFSHLVPEGFGTSDLVLLGHDTLYCVDWKFGKGIRVDAPENPQLRLYACGAVEAFSSLGEIESVVSIVVQPRIDHVSKEVLPLTDLMAWAETVKPLAQRAFNGEGEFVPGDHCGFCRAKATCTARGQQLDKAVIAKFPDPELYAVEELAARLPMLEQAAKWIADVKEHLLKRACDGVPIPGYKLVTGRSDRKYGDRAAVTKALTDAGFDYDAITKPIELLTITEMEKVVGKKRFSELLEGLLVKPTGKPTLVPASDKREAITATTALAFDDLDS